MFSYIFILTLFLIMFIIYNLYKLLASELDNEYLSRHSNSLWRTTEIIRKWMQSEDYYYFKVDSFTLDMKKLTPFYRWPYQSVSY